MAMTKPRERGMIFSAEMVRRLLDGSKTQTRRIVSRSNSEVGSGMYWDRLEFDAAKVPAGWARMLVDNGYLHVPCRPHPYDVAHEADGDWWTRERVYPRWEVGDRLWVKESFTPIDRLHIRYAADEEDRWWSGGFGPDGLEALCERRKAKRSRGNVSPRFAPRWSSRLTLEITEIRVERVQDISEADAQAEGCKRPILSPEFFEHGGKKMRVHPMTGYYRDAFRTLWESIHGKGAFELDQWVWCISLKKV